MRRVRCLVDLMIALQVDVVRACGLGQKTFLSAVRKRFSRSWLCALSCCKKVISLYVWKIRVSFFESVYVEACGFWKVIILARGVEVLLPLFALVVLLLCNRKRVVHKRAVRRLVDAAARSSLEPVLVTSLPFGRLWAGKLSCPR